MSGSSFERLEDVILDQLFPEVDLALRRGRHVGIDDGLSYQLLLDGQVHLEAFYGRYGCELVHRDNERFFYLLPSGDRLGRRLLPRGHMLVGQVLALLYLDPSAIKQGGVVSRAELLGRLDMLVGTESLVRLFQPQRKKYDDRVVEDLIRNKVDEALRSLEALGFVELRDGAMVRLRPALLRFADPIRGRGDDGAALERLIRQGEVVVDAPEEDGEEEG